MKLFLEFRQATKNSYGVAVDKRWINLCFHWCNINFEYLSMDIYIYINIEVLSPYSFTTFYIYMYLLFINLTGHIWRIHSMSKRFLHIFDGLNNWWRPTRRTNPQKCNYKVDVLINYLYRLVYWSWHKMSLPMTGFLELT